MYVCMHICMCIMYILTYMDMCTLFKCSPFNIYIYIQVIYIYIYIGDFKPHKYIDHISSAKSDRNSAFDQSQKVLP